MPLPLSPVIRLKPGRGCSSACANTRKDCSCRRRISIRAPAAQNGNARPEPVTVEVRQQVGGRDVEILSDSIDGEMRDANTIVWKVAVPANGETKVTATVEAGG